MTIELFTSKEYDDGNLAVAVGKITSGDIQDMDGTVLETAPKFLVRWSEPDAQSQWTTHQPFINNDTSVTENLNFDRNLSQPLSVWVSSD